MNSSKRAMLSSEFIIYGRKPRNAYLKQILEMPCPLSFSKQDYHQDKARSVRFEA